MLAQIAGTCYCALVSLLHYLFNSKTVLITFRISLRGVQRIKLMQFSKQVRLLLRLFV